jgi:CobQ/CobB/MinD/ParA nucleotide binding domain.
VIASADQICTHRISIVAGHFGTGKTEFSVNLALDLAARGCKTMLADLDIVNPYFRSRERRDLLEKAGVRVICSSQECADADIPALPAEILTILEDRSYRGVLDIGGDPDGARVLARFQPKIVQEDYQLIFVSNANRPEVRTAERAVSYLRSIEAVTGLSCGGLVNNTHLCGETTPEEILKGARLAAEISRETGIPVLCHTAEEQFVSRLGELDAPIFPITVRMKKPWEIKSPANGKGGTVE